MKKLNYDIVQLIYTIVIVLTFIILFSTIAFDLFLSFVIGLGIFIGMILFILISIMTPDFITWFWNKYIADEDEYYGD